MSTAKELLQQFRPFIGAAELALHRDKWLISKCECFCRILAFSDSGIWITGPMGNERVWWTELLTNFIFEDGTPCGVRIE